MHTLSILMAGPRSADAGSALWGQFIMMGVVFAIFYLLLIAPMRKKQRQLQDVISKLKNGDRVVTTGGILGTVAQVGESSIQLRIADNVKIKVLKSAIAGQQSPESAAEE